MAKFARVGYGSHGQGVGKNPDGYTYLVNDNVNVGDRIQVVATAVHDGVRGRQFGTTAVPLSTAKVGTVNGQEAQIAALSRGDTHIKEMLSTSAREGYITQADLDRMGGITKVYSGKELGIERKGITQLGYRQEVREGNLEKNGATTLKGEQQ